MHRCLKLLFAAVLAAPLTVPAAFAHAFLDHAVPGVGLSVSGPVREIRLYYTQGVVTAFSHVHVASDAGAVIPASKPVNDPSDQQIVIVHLGRALGPGGYSLSWQVLSVDTHVTQGTFHFTVS
ncbi:MAG TPA: copper resistance protein CopC [Methylocella sp.]|nr:copper resistance protein CopC [Methylocella sp.]